MIYQILSDEQFLTLEIEVEESSGIKQLNPTSSDFYIIIIIIIFSVKDKLNL